MKPKKLIVLLLTKNEASNIETTLNACQEQLKALGGMNPTLAVVDDSTDGTDQIAARRGWTVIKGEGRGLGHSYGMGVQWALHQQSDWIMTIDGDGQSPLEEIPDFWRTVQETHADLVIGSRFLNPQLISYEYPKINRIGVWILSNALSFFSGQRITDSHGGIRVFSRRAAETFKFTIHHSYVQETTLNAIAAGLQAVEIPSAWHVRTHGSSRVVRSKWIYIKLTTYPLIATGLKTLWSRATR